MKHMEWKHKITILLAAAWVVFLAAGCAPAAIPTRAASTMVSVAAPAGVVGEALEAAVKAYEESSGQPVQVEILAVDQYYDRLRTYLLAGRSDYDLVYLPADLLPHWAAHHALRPVTISAEERAVLSPWLDALSWDGELYGLPAQADMEVFWYRADLLEQAGLQPPQDWPAFWKTAQALDRPPEHRGVVFAAGASEAGADFAPYLAGFCAPAASWQGCARQQQQQALEFYGRLALDAGASPDSVGYSRQDAAQALKSGRAAMAILPLSYGAGLLACADDTQICQEGRSTLRWAGLPGLGAGQVTGTLSAWVVPLKAARSEEGARLAAWLVGPEGAKTWALEGGLPAHPGVAQDPQVLAGAEAPYLEILARVAHYLPALPATTGAENLWNAYHSTVHTYVAAKLGEQPGAEADAALDSIVEQVKLASRRDGQVE